MNKELKAAIIEYSTTETIIHGTSTLSTDDTKYSFVLEIVLGDEREPLTLRLEQEFLSDVLDGTGLKDIVNQRHQIMSAIKKYSIDKLLDNRL